MLTFLAEKRQSCSIGLFGHQKQENVECTLHTALPHRRAREEHLEVGVHRITWLQPQSQAPLLRTGSEPCVPLVTVGIRVVKYHPWYFLLWRWSEATEPGKMEKEPRMSWTCRDRE